MKTTFEVDDALWRKAKIVAAERGITMREMVERALRWSIIVLPSQKVKERQMKEAKQAK